jgi:hypothetical protein
MLISPWLRTCVTHHARRDFASDTQCPPQEVTPCHEEGRLKRSHPRDTKKQ